ncbi:acyl-CoA carboxylase subunit epsilon [Streptomyces boninensis]|uniref:acyl-CoA carboxylase subunit epsilon n=1 Tax=Streptomyces boninensis TaxID=2039455 RepID=UPI003B227A79
MEATLWKVISGSPTPEELAAVTAVLSALLQRTETHETPAPVIPLARWSHPAAPRAGGSWRIAA